MRSFLKRTRRKPVQRSHPHAIFLSSIQKGMPHMNLQSQLAALQEQSRDLRLPERAALCCRLAKQLEEAGEYEAAREALCEFWPDHDGAPVLDGLDALAEAEILQRVGSLVGWRGST